MKLQITIYLFVIVFISTTCCSSGQNKTKMFEDQLKEYKETTPYKEAVTAAGSYLQKWIAEGVEEVQILKECNWKIDDAIFFNTKKDRCYLLLLIQDNVPDAELDYVYLMYGALEGGKWKIYFSSLPNYVYLRARLKLPKSTAVPMKLLSKLSREELLKAYYNRNGDINDSFINKAYTTELKERHLKFLKERN